MVRQARLWIAVVDGEHARLVQRAEDNALHTQEMVDSPQAHQSASDLGSERPGRSFESASPTRHSITPRNDLHEQAQVDFAHSVAARLNAADQDGAFDQLVLVAPPEILHAMQAKLDPGTAARVIGTLMKNLVKTPDDKLQSHLEDWVDKVVRR